MRLSIMQPAYLPWIGYFQRIALSDLHVVLDHVQLDENSKTKFANRNRIRTPQGWTWLTVPLKTKNRFGALEINRLEIDNEQAWAARHASGLRHNYGRTRFFRPLGEALLSNYENPPRLLVEMINPTTSQLLRAFALDVPMRSSSELPVQSKGSSLILEICRIVGATEYISGPFGRDYLDSDAFAREGIKLLFHDYEPAPYPQAFPGFEPYLSALDLICNMGEEGKEFLARGAKLKSE